MNRPLRVLFVPEMYSSRRMTGISMFSNVLDMVRATVGKLYWYFVVPPMESDYEPLDVKLPNLELLHLGPEKFEPALPVNPPLPWRLVRYLLEKGTELPFDVVLNQKYTYSTTLKDMMFRKDMMWMCGLDLPVVTYLTESGLDPDLPYLRQDSAIMGIMGGVSTGHTVVLCNADKEFVLDHARKYLSPWVVKNAMDRVHVVRPGVDWSLVDARKEQYERERAERRKTGVVHFFHGGTFEAKKHVPQLAEMTVKLREMGMPVKFVVKTQLEEKRASSKEFIRFDGVEVQFDVNRTTYLESLGQGDVLLCTIEYEGTGLAYLEAVRSGMVGAFLDRPWIRERLTPEYPFAATSLEGLQKKLWAVVKDLDWARAESAKLTEKWATMFSATEKAEQMVVVLNKAVEEAAAKERKKVSKFYAFDPIKKYCETVSEFTVPQLGEGAKAFSRSKEFNVRSFGLPYLRRAAAECGFVDDCLSPEPRFKRAP